MSNIYYILILILVIFMCIPRYEPFCVEKFDIAKADPIYRQYVYSLSSH